VGVIRKFSKQIVRRVSSLVARNELFERQGERPVQPPLSPDAWDGEAGADAETPAAEDDDEEHPCSAGDSEALKSAMSAGPVIINHWATWCESCMAETEAVRTLVDAVNVPILGVSWDAFEGRELNQAVADVAVVAHNERMNWPHIVLSDSPDDFFAAMGLENRQVPQTWFVDARGTIVHRVEGVIELEQVPALVKVAESLR
jgi:thiol-disulfide isomerase/thioredoxin